MAIRFRSRYLHATVVAHLRAQLTELGWMEDPVNFATTPVTLIDYQPDERDTTVAVNTVAVTIGDVDVTTDEELGGATGGATSLAYPIFFDVYMSEQALSVAISDDIRDVFENTWLSLVDQITGRAVPGARIAFEDTLGPERPGGGQNENFRRYWRIVKTTARLYHQS